METVVVSKLPLSVEVGPFRYKIVLLECGITHEDGSDCQGLTDHDNQKIILDQSLDHEMLVETFFHEILHAVFSAVGLDFEFGEKKEERYVRSISPILLDTLRRNPLVAQYLLSQRSPEIENGFEI